TKTRSREGMTLPPLHHSPLSRLRERGGGEGGGDGVIRNQRAEVRHQKCVIARNEVTKQSSDFFVAHIFWIASLRSQ
ncbi:MAG: hypothetical protein FWC35_05225, partial [Proteobacteria bacterium]|nr:hypothetical protein [Pseudomonadota bacterium]